jgi:enoyl-CoA hydratase
MYTNILIEEKDQIARVTINRPSFLNALNKETIQELHDAFYSLDTNNNVGVIIITGSGEKSFVAGADIKEFADFSIAQGGNLQPLARRNYLILLRIFQNPSLPP